MTERQQKKGLSLKGDDEKEQKKPVDPEIASPLLNLHFIIIGPINNVHRSNLLIVKGLFCVFGLTKQENERMNKHRDHD